MKKTSIVLVLAIMVNMACKKQKNSVSKTDLERSQWEQTALDRALDQIMLLDRETHTDSIPRALYPDGSIMVKGPRDWTSGFFAGTLWYAYELTKKDSLLATAKRRTAALKTVQNFTHTHDVGFMTNCSFGNGLRLSDNHDYDKIMLKAANNLADRYNPEVGAIKSWDFGAVHGWLYPVIVDNMMNLELLFEAYRLSGNKKFYEIAVTHANTTLKNHFRDDNSSYHVLDYDPVNGEVRSRQTHQGYSDGSAWARGQAWGLYGYTVCYRYTKDEKYLNQAKSIADFYMNHSNLPKDLVPYWDFNAPNIPDEARDASAAAIVSSALLELSGYLSKEGQKYYDFSVKTLKSLSSSAYLSKKGDNQGFILDHSTGSFPGGSEIDVPINYADYYYLEALVRYNKRKIKSAD